MQPEELVQPETLNNREPSQSFQILNCVALTSQVQACQVVITDSMK
jgi:hypothetical protein